MDPKTTFAIMGDTDLTLSENAAAAIDMLVWLVNNDAPISMGISRSAAKQRAERVLWALVDEHEGNV